LKNFSRDQKPERGRGRRILPREGKHPALAGVRNHGFLRSEATFLGDRKIPKELKNFSED